MDVKHTVTMNPELLAVKVLYGQFLKLTLWNYNSHQISYNVCSSHNLIYPTNIHYTAVSVIFTIRA